MNTIVLVLRSGGDFSFSDVELISYHLHKQHKTPLQIICLSDMVNQEFQLKNCTLLPTPHKEWAGWWTKMNLFSPDIEKYRPFLYVDLDTAIVGDITDLFVRQETGVIGLEDFYHKGKFASGIMWIPANSEEVKRIWKVWNTEPEQHIKKYRGDQNFLSNFILSKRYWQGVTNKICSFKVRENDKSWLQEIPDQISVVCFHGKPRISDAQFVNWIRRYVAYKQAKHPKVSVIIPYKTDRGWLQQAVDSAPSWVQVIVSQGEGDWAENFNKALPQVTGDYIKFLHEDDMLTPNCIEDSVDAIEEQGVDFIHGCAENVDVDGALLLSYQPFKDMTYEYLLKANHMHGGTLMFRREVFDKLGGFDESLHFSEEYEFNLRAMQAGFRLGYCDKVLYKYRIHPNQKSKLYEGDLNDTGREVSKSHQEKYNTACQKTN